MPPRRLLPVLVSLVAIVGCGGQSDEGGASRTAEGFTVEDPGLIHAHGVGVNPEDGAIFIATHTGLFRISTGERNAKRVGDRLQDTMAFTVLGPDRFIGSGHPDAREDLPPFLGLIESRDAGETWEPISLQGQADFHLLESAGDFVYGFGSDWDTRDPVFLASTDGGRSWKERSVPELFVGLAIDPNDGRRLVASGETSLYTSSDRGETWRTAPGRPGLLTWPTEKRVYVAEERGVVRVSANGGRQWRAAGNVGGGIAAFEGGQAGQLLAVLHNGTLKQSTDLGKSWTVRATP